MQIQEVCRQFYDYSRFIRGYSDETIKRYKNGIEFFSRVEKIETVNQISDQNVKDFFLYGRTNRDWQSSTFITYHKTLVVFLRWCVEKKYISENYAEDIETPKLNKKLPSRLTKQQANRILEITYNYPYKYTFLRYRNHAMFSVFFYTGLRKKELLKLRYADVDLDNLSIFVYQGKGSKDRIIPISSKLAEILSKYVSERKRLDRTCPEFFTSLNRNNGVSNSSLKRLISKIKDVSGIYFTAHKLRHTFATLMLEGGCDIYSLSRMMGHRDIKTTTIYLATSAEHLRKQMGKHPLNEL
jgi:site-specific recombinase XerD